MNEKICKNCRYFGEEVTIGLFDENFDLHETKTGFHTCERIKHNEDGYSSGLWTEAHVVDGSGYFAALRVPADFGCVMFEKKDPD